MELVDFQEIAVRNITFIDLTLKLQEKEVKPLANVTKGNEPLESGAENLILSKWQSLPLFHQ